MMNLTNFIVMKHLNSWCLIALLTVSVSACKKEEPPVVEEPLPTPLADFTYEQVSEEDPFTYKFTNLSENFEVVRWEFGDDSSSVVPSPTHTFLNPGEYRVLVRAINADDYWAEKETVILIHPDSLFEIEALPLGAGLVRLGVDTRAALQTTEWYRGLGSDAELIGEGKTIDVTLEADAFQLYSARVKTPQGSSAEVNGLLSHLGLVHDVTEQGFLDVSRENSGGPTHGEGSPKLIDNNPNTKFLSPSFDGTLWIKLSFSPGVKVDAYTFTSANDDDRRDPVDWTLEGSNDEEEWVLLDTRTDEVFESRFLTKTYMLENTAEYMHYRLNIKSNGGSSLFQMAEWRLLQLPTDEKL